MYYLKDMKLYIFQLLQIMLLCTMPLIHMYTPIFVRTSQCAKIIKI